MPGKNGNKNGNGHKPDNLATVMTQVSEQVTVLVKEELELAKAEVQQKISSLSKGLIAGGIGLVLALLFVPFALLTLAWGLNSLLSSIWLGFAIVMGVLLIAMLACGWIAYRKIKSGVPVPKTAIEEAKKIRETVSARGNGSGNGSPAPIAPAPQPVVAAAVPATPVVAAPAPSAPEPAAVAPVGVAPAAQGEPAEVAVAAPEAPVPVPVPDETAETADAPTTEAPTVVAPAEKADTDAGTSDADTPKGE